MYGVRIEYSFREEKNDKKGIERRCDSPSPDADKGKEIYNFIYNTVSLMQIRFEDGARKKKKETR